MGVAQLHTSSECGEVQDYSGCISRITMMKHVFTCHEMILRPVSQTIKRELSKLIIIPKFSVLKSYDVASANILPDSLEWRNCPKLF